MLNEELEKEQLPPLIKKVYRKKIRTKGGKGDFEINIDYSTEYNPIARVETFAKA